MYGEYISAAAAIIAAALGLINRHKIQQVHVLVNSNLTQAIDRLKSEQNRTEQLKDTLKDAGTPIPPIPETEKEAP